MLNCSASLAVSTSVLKALPGKFDIKDTHLVFSMKISTHYYLILVPRVGSSLSVLMGHKHQHQGVQLILSGKKNDI